MKKVLLITLMIAFFAVNAPAEQIKVAYLTVPPTILSKEGGEPIGALAAYWREMAGKMGVSIKWVGPMTVPRVLHLLKKQEVDASVIAVKRKIYTDVSLLPQKPFIVTKTVICVHKDTKLNKIENWMELNELQGRIAILYGSSLEKALSKGYPKLRLSKIKGKEPASNALKALRDKKAAAFIYPSDISIAYWIKKLGITDTIKLFDAPMSPNAFYAAFAKNRKDLLKKFEEHQDKVVYDTDFGKYLD